MNTVAALQEATLKKEDGGKDTMGLTPAELQKKAKEEEKERKKREKEEEKRRKKEEEERKKAEKAAKKGKGKVPVDPTAEDRRDHMVRVRPSVVLLLLFFGTCPDKLKQVRGMLHSPSALYSHRVGQNTVMTLIRTQLLYWSEHRHDIGQDTVRTGQNTVIMT